ncbi:tripartite tricarboxylate transporter substrate-binding protein [Cupriavidus consociatus]|uniref:tripartite tricarboxylate transporter substrate-binding protein n=1 Tax=Cupriavidus consociatus TaxID=2821357 RepID=UPI0024756D3C|nr:MULTISPECIES: tripartite tricarboxylate transporter substrate-binding protein [unclassified Cupriavidus]MDK2659042.1 tripartite tricarboxylate transporter substrate-binding protein [Cupriavidus sp. LEh21]
MPAAIVQKLNAEINAILSDPKIMKQPESLGATVAPGSPAQFADLIKADASKWGAVIKAGHISID